MAVYSCPRIEITVPKGKEDAVFSAIQKLGTVELIEQKDGLHLPEEMLSKETAIMSQLEVANKAHDALSTYKPKPSALAFLIDERVEVSSEEFANYSSQKDELVAKASAIVKNHEEELLLNEEIEQLEKNIRTVTPFKDVDVKIFGEFAYVAFVPFFVHESRSDAVLAEITKRFPEAVVEAIDKLEEEYVYVAAVQKEQKEDLLFYLIDNTTVISIETGINGSFRDVYAESTTRLEASKQRVAEIQAELKKAAESITEVAILKDVLHSELAQVFTYHSLKQVSPTTAVVEGYVDPKAIDNTLATLHEISDVSVKIDSEGPSDKVVMRNNWFVKPFQIVTQMMGTPVGNAIDPTPFLAFFFLIMYGLALTEAGYALVCLLITGPLLLLVKRMKSGPKDLFTVIFYASISTLILGAIFGSWFGVTPSAIDVSNPDQYLPHTQFLINIGVWPLAQQLQLLDPLAQILALMVAMCALGIVHLLIGLGIGVAQSIKRGQLLEGVLTSGTWFGFLVLFVLYVLGMQGLLGEGLANSSILMYVLVGYILIMIPIVGKNASGIVGKFGMGAFDLFFGAIGYISDILSYTRLVALGLATGIIASVVNTLAALAGGGLASQGGGKMIIGYAIMLVVFLGGHVFNIALNVLGSYITVGRLHFVEFFGKFFESGGQELQPFAPSEEYIKLTNSN